MSDFDSGKTQLEGTPSVTAVVTGEVEVKNDTGSPIPVSGTVTANAGVGPFPVSDNGGSLTVDGTVAVSNFPATQAVTEANIDLNFGTWGYASGTSGTPTIGAGKRVLSICAHSLTGGSFTINGGNTITVPANVSVNISPMGNLTNPTIVFTGTDTFFVEFVS